MKRLKKCKVFNILPILLFFFLFFSACKKNIPSEPLPGIPDSGLGIYIPSEMKNMNLNDSTSQWSYKRSRQSEHFVVFWDKKYSNNDPGSEDVAPRYRVNIDTLLEKVESYYKLNVELLKFVTVGNGNSNLDKYKMMIFLYYQDTWLATGSGYDDVIGALWVSPQTCQPIGSTIAHEIGHSFQYQVYCDLKGTSGFRYGFGGNGGNVFWEQTAQWQSFQSYPSEIFTNYYFNEYVSNTYRHIFHEDSRYANYFIHYYWASKHGMDIVSKIWQNAKEPEDPAQAYMRLTGLSNEQFNDEIYEAATRFATWDIDAIRNEGKNSVGKMTYKFDELSDGSFKVAVTQAPQATGYNVVPLNVPEVGTVVSVKFSGIANEQGYNHVDASVAGWRYGYVALLKNGTRVYSDMFKSSVNSEGSFHVPADCDKLWFVVTAAPTSYVGHSWDDDSSNDDQWPYKVKFTNTNLLGYIDLGGNTTPQNKTISFDLSFKADSQGYSGTTVQADINSVVQAFVLQPSRIRTMLSEGKIKFYAVEANGSLNPQTTANGYGHWFDGSGNVINWGDNSVLFSEFDENSFIFNIGQYPGHAKAGDKYTIKQALVYSLDSGESVRVVFEFNISIL